MMVVAVVVLTLSMTCPCWYDVNHRLQHTAVVTSESLKNKVVLGSYADKGAPVVYSGVGHALEEDNILSLKVIGG